MRSTVLVAALLGTLLFPAAGSAARFTVGLPLGDQPGTTPSLAAAADGSTAVAYVVGQQIVGAAKPAGAGPSTPAALTSPSQTGFEPVTAVNAGGAALAAWSGTSGADEGVGFSAGTTGAGFTPAGFIVSPGAGSVSAGIDGAGTQWIAWTANPAGARLKLARRGAGEADFSVTDVASDASEPQLAVAEDGGVTLTWITTTRSKPSSTVDRTTTAVVRLAVGSDPVVLATASLDEDDSNVVDGDELSEPTVAATAGGGSVVAWRRSQIIANDPEDDTDDETAASIVASTGGGAPAPVAVAPELTSFALAGREDGRAAIVWDQPAGRAGQTVNASVRPAGGTFGPAVPVAVGTGANPVSDPAVAVLADGDAFVTVSRLGDSTASIEAVLVKPTGPVAVPDPPGGADVQDTALAADDDGDAILAYSAPLPMTMDRRVEVAAYDAAGPRLLDLTVPAAGTAGAALSFSVRPVDAWSDVTGTRWTFGDGDTADGGAVTHAYRADGAYDASVQATDAAGNATTSPAARVTIGAATGQPTPTPTPAATPPALPAPVDLPPTLSELRLLSRCVSPASPKLDVRFRLSEDSTMTYVIRRRNRSLRRTTCPPAQPGGRQEGTYDEVTRQDGTATAGEGSATIARAAKRPRTVRRDARRGAGRARLAQVLRGLRPGTYQLAVIATDAAGGRSREAVVKFWILRSPKGSTKR